MQRFTPSVVAIGATAASVALAAGITASASVGSDGSRHARSDAVHYTTSGSAFGSRLDAASIARSDDSALTTVGCNAGVITRNNSTAASDLDQVGSVQSVRTQTQSDQTAAGDPVTNTLSHVTGTSLLGGVVKFGDLKTTATAEPGPGLPTSGDTRFYGLQIAGHGANQDPAPNTSYTLPGVGKLVLNAQRRTSNNGVHRITVDGLDLTLLRNSKFGDKGTTVVLGRASAALHSIVGSPLKGVASGTEATVGDTVASNPTYEAKVPCANSGTNQQVGAGIHLGSLLNTGNVHTVGQTQHDGDTKGSTTSSVVSHVNLLNGLVTAGLVRAQANATQTPESLDRDITGSRIDNLRIDGKRVAKTNAPNTKEKLPGIGTLWLNRTTRSDRGIEVHAMQLVLNKAIDHMKKGTVVNIANAEARVGRNLS